MQCKVPAPNLNFTAIATGFNHGLGLKQDGSIVTWGANDDKQCDVPAPNSNYLDIAAGYSHSLGLKADGALVAWGNNHSGQCSIPTPNSNFIAAAGGANHSLGLKADGSIAAWGDNAQGQCNVPAPNTDFIAVAAGCLHSLGLKKDGTIVAWGYNWDGQCDVPSPNIDFIAISAGNGHSLGLKKDNSIIAWGSNRYGQCNVSLPNEKFVAVAAGCDHSLGLKSDGSIVAWGSNSKGECNVPTPNSGITSIASMGYFNLGLKRMLLHPDFEADIKSGWAPLRVQFTDKTSTSDPGGVLTWAWDFDGNNRVDSTTRNPVWIYPTQGRTVNYDVKLSVTDTINPPAMEVKRGYITVDPQPVADFTASPRTGSLLPGGPPLIVSFTDLSAGATAWAWDLTGNSRIDSTQQNPVFPYVEPRLYSVRLLVSGVGGNNARLKCNYIYVSDTLMVIVPEDCATTEGDSGSAYPWNRSSESGFRRQFCYSASHFAGITSPLFIEKLRWRADGTSRLSWTGVTIPNTVIQLSSAVFPYTSLSSSFAANHGNDQTNAFTGTVSVVPCSNPCTPNIWYVTVRLQTPFIYDPTANKDLLVDITVPGRWAGSGSSFNVDVQTTGARASSLSSTWNATEPTGSIAVEHGPVMEIGYRPATGLQPYFSSNLNSGPGPLRVAFFDKSYSSDPGGILTWAWDFNGDSKIDSTVQNPVWIYPAQNRTVNYDVTLSVTDATHPPSKHTIKDFITVIGTLGGTFTIGPIGDYVSIQQAANALANFPLTGPVTFLVAPGVYRESVTFKSNPSASFANTITFKSERPFEAKLIGTSGPTIAFEGGSEWYVLDGFEFTSGPGNAISVNYSSNIVVKNCNFKGSHTGIIAFGSNQMLSSSNWSIFDCHFEFPSGRTGILVSEGPMGISTLSSLRFFRNVVNLNGCLSGIKLRQGDFQIYNNIIFGSVLDSAIECFGSSGSFFPPLPPPGSSITHNTFIVDANDSARVLLIPSTPLPMSIPPAVYNNIFLNLGGGPILMFEIQGGLAGYRGDGNLFFRPGPISVKVGMVGTTTATGRPYDLPGWRAATNGNDSASMICDPLLSVLSPPDIRFAPNSRAKDSAQPYFPGAPATLINVIDDFFGTRRGTRPDIGAYELPDFGFILYGVGCPGSGLLVPVIEYAGSTAIGSPNFRVTVGNALGGTPAFLLLGENNLFWGGTPLPYVYAKGCNLYQDLVIPVGMVLSGFGQGKGTGSVLLPIPNDPALTGAALFLQWLIADQGAPNIYGLVTTRGAQLRL